MTWLAPPRAFLPARATVARAWRPLACADMSSPAPAAAAEPDACFAPELPLDALRLILAPYAGCVATLCAAACVSRAWHAASKEHWLWTNLNFSDPFKSREWAVEYVRVDDARLAELVTRAGSGVDGQPHLQRLDVTKCMLITTRGVVAALTGAGLEGKLICLQVAETRSVVGDEDVIDDLDTFLDTTRWVSGLDVHDHLLCGTTDPFPCSRLCRHVLCDTCEPPIIRCGWCYPGTSYLHYYSGKLFCEHMCTDCGGVAESGLRSCAGCSSTSDSDELDERTLCDSCTWMCDGECGQTFCCKFCIDSSTYYCPYCGTFYCEECSDDVEWQYCGLCSNTWCLGSPEERAAVNHKSAVEWIAELQERDVGLRAEALERLLALVQAEGEINEGDVPCEICKFCIDDKILKIDDDD